MGMANGDGQRGLPMGNTSGGQAAGHRRRCSRDNAPLLPAVAMVHKAGVTRRRLLLMIAAAAAGGAFMLALYDPAIDAPAAAALADRMATSYQSQSGLQRSAFAAREGRQWADGWEFRWRFKPCPELACLRVWVSRNGRKASFAEIPDCAPAAGLGVPPRTV